MVIWHDDWKLLWEFVDGKVEPGEMKEQALVRECREELGITVAVGNVFTKVTHAYPNLTVHLTLFNSRIAAGEPQLLEHNDLHWITPDEIDSYYFCPADEAIPKEIVDIDCLTGHETEGCEYQYRRCRVSALLTKAP